MKVKGTNIYKAFNAEGYFILATGSLNLRPMRCEHLVFVCFSCLPLS